MNTLKTVSTKRRPINLFFTELIISLLFFCISGAVILNLFAAADKKSRMNAMKENAVICAQSIAEVYSVGGYAEEAIKTVFSQNGTSDSDKRTFTVMLDSYCRAAVDGSIKMTAIEEREKTAAGELSRLKISFEILDEELYTLICTAYIPDGGNGNA